MQRIAIAVTILLAASIQSIAETTDIFDEVEHHYVDNEGVNIHYVTVGEGPVVLFVHGVPEFWYTWYRQMDGLKDAYKCVALDTRGYNKSEAPEGQENYSPDHIQSDVQAVIDDIGAESITLVGHDYGGLTAWLYAMNNPDVVVRLIICNTTHPRGYQKVVQTGTPAQRAALNYIDRLQEEGAEKTMFDPQMMVGFAAGFETEIVKAHYREALSRVDRINIVYYYRNLYPYFTGEIDVPLPDLEMPVLQIHGLADVVMDKDGLRDTWNWVTQDYTLVTIPGAGHFVQRQKHELVTSTIRSWLDDRR